MPDTQLESLIAVPATNARLPNSVGRASPSAAGGWEHTLDNFPLWYAVAVVFIIIAYVPYFIHYPPPHLTLLPFTGF